MYTLELNLTSINVIDLKCCESLKLSQHYKSITFIEVRLSSNVYMVFLGNLDHTFGTPSTQEGSHEHEIVHRNTLTEH